MQKSLGWALVCGLLACPTAWAWYPYSEKYEKWQKDRPMMFAGLHNSVPKDKLEQRIARFKAGGLNTFLWAKPHHAMEYFRAAHDAGLSWACWHRGGKSAVMEAMKIPGAAFIQTGDEPGTGDDEIDHIAQFAKWARQTYPDLPQFVNLSIVKADHDVVIRRCKPDVFSFDHYPLNRNGKFVEDYLYTVKWGRQTSQRHRLPFWMYLQSYGRVEDKPSYAYRIPDEADIRYQLFTLLAHGGTGVMWFIYYGMNESMVMQPGIYMPVEPGRYEDNIQTRAWYAVRDVAPEGQQLARALLNLRSKDPVAYAGDGRFWDIPPSEYGAYNPVEPIRNTKFEGFGALKALAVTEGEDMGLLVGFFDDEMGEEYFMVVNLAHGLNMSKSDGMRTVRLTFANPIETIERLNRLTGLVEPLRTTVKGDTRVLDIFLPGGTGDLFKWSNGKSWALRKAN